MKFPFRIIPMIVLALLVAALFPATLTASESQNKLHQQAAGVEKSGVVSFEQVVAEPSVNVRVEQHSQASARDYGTQVAAATAPSARTSRQDEIGRRARDNTVRRINRARSGTNASGTDYDTDTGGESTARSSPLKRSEASTGTSFNALNQTLGWRS